MPCNSDHMRSTNVEIEMGKVVLLLDELNGFGAPDPTAYVGGYDKRVYNVNLNQQQRDQLVANLCERISAAGDISGYSLELQTWWRDHQAADARRRAREGRERDESREHSAAIEKLTPRERKLLGVEK